MSLQTRLAALITAIGADIKAINTALISAGAISGPDVTRTSDYSGAGDDTGLMYLLGTESGAYAYPSPLKVAITSSPAASGTWPITNAFDRNAATFYHSDGSGNDYVMWDFGAVPNRKAKIRAYQYKHRADQNVHKPRSWKLQGSDDGTTWTDLDTRTANTDINAAGAVATWTVTGAAAYRFIRFRLTAQTSDGTWYLNIAELELFGDVIDAGTKAGIQVVTALPAVTAADNGKEVYLQVDSAAAYGGPFLWHCRYKYYLADGSVNPKTYKWDVLRATPLRHKVTTQETRANATAGDLTTVGPSITIPVAGDYDVKVGAKIQANVAGVFEMWMGVSKDGAAPVSEPAPSFVAVAQYNGGTVWDEAQMTGIAVNTLLRAKYWTQASLSGAFMNRVLMATPVRIG